MMTPQQSGYLAAYLERHGEEPYLGHCAAMHPATGHQCELSPDHGGHHDRIISGSWVRWCDEPQTCNDEGCDVRHV
jgi:hypothetical protein